MFLVLVMALGLFPISAFAASSTIGGALGEVNITNGGYKMSYLSMNGVVRSQSYTYFNFKSASGAIKEIPAYCINPTTKGVPQSVSPGESIKYIANEASNDPKIVGIIANGYPHRGLSELKLDNKYQAYYATKMALWCYLIDGWSIDRLTVNPSLSGVEKERGEKLLAAAKDIYKRGTWWNRVPQPTITVTADKDSAYPVTIDGKEYLQQVFTADSETWVCDYDIDIGFTMPDEVPEGTRIVDMNNNDITKIRTSPNGASYAGQFKVLYPKDSVSDQTGAVQMSLHANVYKYAIYYALCAETSKYGTLQRYMCDTDPTTEIRQSTFSRYSAAPSDTPDEPETSTETTLIIKKVETGTNTPLSGATFEVKAPDGTVLGSFVTDTSGKIIIPLTLSGQYVITEKTAPKWHLLGTETTKTVSVDYGNTATVTFENAPYGNLRVDKIDADSGASLAGATVEIKHIESGVTQTGTTDLGGSVYFDKLKPGAYQVREVSAPSGFVKDDQTYVYIDKTLTDGKYLVREIQAADGYALDTTVKTFYVEYGGTSTITWKNTPITGQIQIVKKSADYNPTNGLPAETLLEGAVFEITDKAGNVVDTIRSNSRGLAVSKQLPLSRYFVREIKAPEHYGINDKELTAYLEYEGQILRFEVEDKSLSTGVAITKTGPKEIVAGQPVRYAFSGIANTSNVSLSNFYWRDTLPAQVRLDTVVTGTYNRPGTYKIVYRVNGGGHRTLADNLSTQKNYTLAASATALKLASNERVTEIMFVFGQAPAGFAQVEKPYLHCKAVTGLSAGSFVNVADVGGTYGGTWVQGISRWVTTVYGKPVIPTLPKTGY